MRRTAILSWFLRALDAVDPRRLTAERLADRPPATVIAIGKAAVGMVTGAADAWGRVRGVCVADAPGDVPEGIEILVGDHPIPGAASFAAGRRVLDVARESDQVVVLLSGGGSALCEWPLPGITPEFIAETTRALLNGGASIGETNLVRAHLSALKAGGLARAAGPDLLTLVLMDVGSLGPEMVASGPTLGRGLSPEMAIEVMRRYGIEPPPDVVDAIEEVPADPVSSPVEVIADGRDAGEAMVEAARLDGLDAYLSDGWIEGAVPQAVDRFLDESDRGVMVGAGEATLEVSGDGRGGRNTHAALEAAVRISGQDIEFAALSTDGVDGASGAAGAIVDGTTITRGGDPTAALAAFDSATYLERIGDLVVTGRTGTNVADLWVVWR
ncbi:MAG TPA: DUF4147 domain-containing protein [Acidimicrobiia bacterium]